jgi:hypothetical protein
MQQVRDFTVVCLAILIGSAAPCVGDVREISHLTLPHTVVDFEVLPSGPTDISTIRTSGQALGGRPDGSGSLIIVDTLQPFDSGRYVVDLLGPTTQFGFEIEDQTMPFTLQLYRGETLVGSHFASATCWNSIAVESDEPFDRIVFDTLSVAG